jgi:hypothetical protein
MKPDLGFAYVNCISVNDTGLACDVCVSGERYLSWGPGFHLQSSSKHQMILLYKFKHL